MQILTHERHAIPASIAIPEAFVLSYEVGKRGTQLEPSAVRAIREADVVLVGPGLADEGPDLARVALREASPDASVLLDAAALEGVDPAPLRSGCVLLPNPGEVSLVAGEVTPMPSDPVGERSARRPSTWRDAQSPLRWSAAPQPRSRILMAACSRVLDDPCPGLGVAGSGDVLTGVVAAFCRRAPNLATGAAWAVLAHHEAGRSLEHETGKVGFLAREIADRIPSAVQELLRVADRPR